MWGIRSSLLAWAGRFWVTGDIDKIKGLRTGEIAACLGEKPYDEVIHRDNLVLTNGTVTDAE